MVNFEATDRQGFGSGSKMYNIESQERNDSIGDVKEERSQSGNSVMYRRVIYSTHFNIFLYSTCFWIQTGTLPVSTVFLWVFFFFFFCVKKINVSIHIIYHTLQCYLWAGIACYLVDGWTHDWKVASSNPGRRIFFSRVNFVLWLLFGVCSTPMLPQCHVKGPGHFAKSVGARLYSNTLDPIKSERADYGTV